jgi:hypothetical protein
MHAAPGAELAVKVVRRKVRHFTQLLQQQRFIKMAFDVVEHFVKALAVGLAVMVFVYWHSILSGE